MRKVILIGLGVIFILGFGAFADAIHGNRPKTLA